MTNDSLWIIEDQRDFIPVYEEIFKQEPVELKFFDSFLDFERTYKKSLVQPSFILVDLTLNDGDFFSQLNQSDLVLTAPFSVISADNSLNSFNTAYQAGAVDYICKPFNQNEVLAKVSRHMSKVKANKLKSRELILSLERSDQKFTNKELKIIESFTAKADSILNRSEITQIIWKDVSIHPNTLDVHIYNLRKKLKTQGFTIKSIGAGYFKFLKDDAKVTQ